MKAFLLFSLSLFSLTGFALNRGHDAGGYVIRCNHPEPNGRTLEVLDYHELRYKYAPGYFVVDLGGHGTEWDRVHFALDRLKRLDPVRAGLYQDAADHFEEQALHVPNVNLPDASDLGKVYLADDCAAIQAVIQYQQPLPGQKKYAVSDKIYQALGLDDRAGLILHEIIYGEALRHGAKNSVDARYFNAVVSSRQIAQLTPEEYEARLSAIGFSLPNVEHPPIWNPAGVGLTAVANQMFSYDLAATVLNPSGGSLKFSLSSVLSWLTLSNNGILSGTPRLADVGSYSLNFVVTSQSGMSISAVLQIVVLADHELKWTQGLIDLGSIQPGKPFMLDLNPFVSNPSGVPLAFRFAGFPTWLTLGIDGVLVGTPAANDVGIVSFPVTVTDGVSLAKTEFHLRIGK